jgi:hypothetical protein
VERELDLLSRDKIASGSQLSTMKTRAQRVLRMKIGNHHNVSDLQQPPIMKMLN